MRGQRGNAEEVGNKDVGNWEKKMEERRKEKTKKGESQDES